jgi:hypothetical protein
MLATNRECGYEPQASKGTRPAGYETLLDKGFAAHYNARMLSV